ARSAPAIRRPILPAASDRDSTFPAAALPRALTMAAGSMRLFFWSISEQLFPLFLQARKVSQGIFERNRDRLDVLQGWPGWRWRCVGTDRLLILGDDDLGGFAGEEI